MGADKKALRKADLRSGILLLLLALAMLGMLADFPMTDSYGGVQNVWYVSPALFPFLIVIGLVLLSLVLIANALRTVRWSSLVENQGFSRWISDDGNFRFASIVLLLGCYVYLLPHVDFFIATWAFLTAFIGGFHVDRRDQLTLQLGLFVSLSLVLGVTGKAAEIESAPMFDIAALVLLALLYLLPRMRFSLDTEQLHHHNQSFWVSGVVPLLLVPAFKYGLLVPMPSEGIAIGLMESLRYALRSLT